jgi:hypothetical protein
MCRKVRSPTAAADSERFQILRSIYLLETSPQLSSPYCPCMYDVDETFQRSKFGDLLKRFNNQFVSLDTYVSEYMLEATRRRRKSSCMQQSRSSCNICTRIACNSPSSPTLFKYSNDFSISRFLSELQIYQVTNERLQAPALLQAATIAQHPPCLARHLHHYTTFRPTD